MANFSFLHAADLHLDSPLRGLEADAPADLIRGATRRALVNLVDLAIAERVAFVLLAGDLYDGDWEDYRTGHFLIEQIGRLTRVGIFVYAIAGNHDAQSVLTRALPWPDGARMFDTARPHHMAVPGLDVVIHGQGYPTRAYTQNMAMDYAPRIPGMLNIGLLHTACGSGQHENYAPCSVEQLVGHGYDYWALGHVHARAELHRHPAWVVFPGNLQGRHIKEEGAKGATLVRVDGPVMTPVHHALDVLRWARVGVDLAGVTDPDAMGARIRTALGDAHTAADGRPLAARVVLLGETVLHAGLARDPEATRQAVLAEATNVGLGDALWLEKVEIATRARLDRDAVARPDAVSTLMRAIEAQAEMPGAAAASAQDYARHMLGHLPSLRPALGGAHAAIRAAAGDVSPELMEQARNLLLAMLDEG